MMPSITTTKSLFLQSVITPNPDLKEELVIGAELIEEDYLVIMVDEPLNQVFMINLDSTARFPILIPYSELIECINTGIVEVLELGLDPKVTMPHELLSEKGQEKVEKRFKHILPLTLDLESVLRNGYGQNIFEDTRIHASKVAGTNKSKQYIYDTFYSWLRHGCRKQGLCMPQGKDANHKPKERELLIKQGRPYEKGKKPRGLLLTDYDYKVFNIGKRLYAKKNGPSIRKTINKLWRKYYVKSKTRSSHSEFLETGEKTHIELVEPHERPSYFQFYGWLLKQYKGVLPKRDRSRKNATEYAANLKGRSGNSFAHIIAPGELYQLDETPFDEELVSVYDYTRRIKLGKATLYFVRDTFSRGIAGVYITTQNPSYATVKEAIFNACRDKADFYREIGCPLDPAKWPMCGAPLAVLVDKAEFHNKISEGPIEDLPITIKFTRSGRGDDKPLAETIFNVFSNFFKGLSEAHQTKSQRDIALQLARKKAMLTIPELYQIALVFIEHYNSTHVINDYPSTKSMKEDKVPSRPNDLWHWGIRYRPGYLLDISEDELYIKLLEKGEVSINKTHILLKEKGLHYNCEWIFDEGHQDRRSSGNKVKTYSCRYFRGLVDTILICTEDGLKIATLDNLHNRFSGLSFEEVKQRKKAEDSEDEDLLEIELNSLVSIEAFTEERLKIARQQKVTGTIPTIQTIKDNRKFEALADRFYQANRFVQTVHNEYKTPSLFNAIDPVSMVETDKESDQGIYDEFYSEE